MSPLVPESFAVQVTGREPGPFISGDVWLTRLPGLLEESLEQWDLTLEGDSMHGVCALVLPVRRRDGSPAVLKVIGTLLHQLNSEVLPQLSRLSAHAAEMAEKLRSAPPAIPRRFVEQARSLLSKLVTDGAIDSRMVNTDLHYRKILSAERQPWLAIAPKPLAADPAFAVAPALWNRWAEAIASGDLRAHLRRRLSIICAGAGLDEERARAWSIVREVQNGLSAIEGDDADELTEAITIIKPMQTG